MNKNNMLRTTAIGLIFMLGGCTYLDRTEGVTSFAGDSQAINAAKQTVDPWNKNAYNNQIEGDGERLGETAKRYKKGERKEEEDYDTVKTTAN